MKVFAWIFTLLAMPLWLPVLLLVAVLSLFVQGLPLLYVDERAGRGGRPFRMYKLRTMRAGAGADSERLTKFGSFLRKSSLDELPELFNVLKGDMTLVGPRPLPVRYLERYDSFQMRRHEVLPGITGWAQVNGRNTLDWDTKFRYDVEYVDRRSFLFDLRILFMTVSKVLLAKDISHPGEATMSEFKRKE